MAAEPLLDIERGEVPLTLVEAPPPRLLGLFDQTALWGNLGISLLLLVAAGFVLPPTPRCRRCRSPPRSWPSSWAP